MTEDCVVARHHYDSQGVVTDVEIVEAPARAEISLAVVANGDPRFFQTIIRMGGTNPVEYRVTGPGRDGLTVMAERVT